MDIDWRLFVPLLLFMESVNLSAQSRSSVVPLISYPIIVQTGLPTAGIGHFLRKDYLGGSIFALSQGGTYLLSQAYLNWRKGRPKPDTLAYPCISSPSIIYRTRGFSSEQLAGIQLAGYSYQFYYNLRLLDAFTTYRDYRAEEDHTLPLTDRSIPDLSLSPFQWKYLREPSVFIPALAAVGASLMDNGRGPSLFDAKTLNWFGLNVTPTETAFGTTALEAFGFAVLAVAEEGFFRGVLQTELSEHVNPTFGIVASSVLFGLAHYPMHGLTYAARAGVAGLYLGWQYKESHYDLGRTIAIHFYIDFAPLLVQLFRDPIEARGVYSIEYGK